MANCCETIIYFLTLKKTKFGFIGIDVLRLIAKQIYATRFDECWKGSKWNRYYGIGLHEEDDSNSCYIEDITTSPSGRIDQFKTSIYKWSLEYQKENPRYMLDYDDLRLVSRLVNLNIMNKSVVIYFNGQCNDQFAKQISLLTINYSGDQRDSTTLYLIPEDWIFMKKYPRMEIIKRNSEHCAHCRLIVEVDVDQQIEEHKEFSLIPTVFDGDCPFTVEIVPDNSNAI
jgi:hypothetical protein